MMELDEWLTLNLSNATNAVLTDSEDTGLVLNDDTSGSAASTSLSTGGDNSTRRSRRGAAASWLFQQDSPPKTQTVGGGRVAIDEIQPLRRLPPSAVDLFMLDLAERESTWE
jgi:hypothetical protein